MTRSSFTPEELKEKVDCLLKEKGESGILSGQVSVHNGNITNINNNYVVINAYVDTGKDSNAKGEKGNIGPKDNSINQNDQSNSKTKPKVRFSDGNAGKKLCDVVNIESYKTLNALMTHNDDEKKENSSVSCCVLF